MKRAASILFASLTCSLSAFAYPDFSGHWVSTTGTISSDFGASGTCTKFDVVITQQPDKLITQSFVSDCGEFSSNWGPAEEDFKGGDVYEEGDKVGTISNDTMITVSGDGTSSYAYNLKLIEGTDGKPAMELYYGVKGAFGTLVTESTLQKTP